MIYMYHIQYICTPSQALETVNATETQLKQMRLIGLIPRRHIILWDAVIGGPQRRALSEKLTGLLIITKKHVRNTSSLNPRVAIRFWAVVFAEETTETTRKTKRFFCCCFCQSYNSTDETERSRSETTRVRNRPNPISAVTLS